MHIIDMFVLFSIGHVVAWPVAIYVDNDLLRAVGHLVFTMAGAFVGGYLSLIFIAPNEKFSMIFAGFIGAGILLYLFRFRKWR